jgi:hypothetical protein
VARTAERRRAAPARGAARRDTLSPAHAQLQQRSGYPHVFEHGRFHMTLSDALEGDTALRERQLVVDAQFFETALGVPLPCGPTFEEAADRAARFLGGLPQDDDARGPVDAPSARGETDTAQASGLTPPCTDK